MGLGAVRPMLFAKPNVIDPNPTRNLHSRILNFLFGPIPVNCLPHTELKNLVTPRICYFQISTRSIAKPPAVLPYGAWLFSGLRTLPLRSCNSPAAFQTLGCHFDNFCFGLQRAYVCDSIIFEGDFKTSLAPVAKPFWPRKWRAQSNIFRLLVFAQLPHDNGRQPFLYNLKTFHRSKHGAA